MAFQPFGDITQNNFKLIPLDTPVGTRVKCILRAYKEGFDDIVLETLPVTVTERPSLSGSDVYLSDRVDGAKIQTILDNNFIFAVDDIVGEDGVTYEFYVEYPAQLEVLESGSGYPGISGDYGSSLPGWSVDGVPVEHRPYFGGTTEGLTANVGDQTAYGADETAIVQWTCRNATIMDEDAIDGYYYVSLQAYHHSGIQKVQFQLNDGPVLEVTETINHPIDGIPEYICKVNINDSNLKILNEVRAIVYPNDGRKVLIQGFGYYPQTFYGGDITGGGTGDLVDPTIDNDYVSFNSNGDNLHYTSLFLYKRQSEYNYEIYLDYENGSDETGNGSSDNPYKTLGVAIQKYSTDILNNNSINQTPYLNGGIIKLKPGNHVIGGLNNYSSSVAFSELGKLFPVVITSSDENDRATIIGSQPGPASNGNDPTFYVGTVYNILIKNIDFKEDGTTYVNGGYHTVRFQYPNLEQTGKSLGRYFSCIHEDNLLIQFPNDTRPYVAGLDPTFPENKAQDGELIFKWRSPHTEGTDFNPNYPPHNASTVEWDHIYYVPNHGIQVSSRTYCITKFYANGAGFGGMLARGNRDYSSFGSLGYVCHSSVNNKCYWCSIEVPTEVDPYIQDNMTIEQVQSNISPTAFFWTGLHADHYQIIDGAFGSAAYRKPNKYNYYPKILTYNTNNHRNYNKKADIDGVAKTQFFYDAESSYVKFPGDYAVPYRYKWETGQGVYRNIAAVNNEHLNSGYLTSFSITGLGKACINYHIVGNTFGSQSNISMAAKLTAIKSMLWKNNYDENGEPVFNYGGLSYKDYTLGSPIQNQSDTSSFYSPYYTTSSGMDLIPFTIGVTYSNNYELTDPGATAERVYEYLLGPTGYNEYYGLDIWDDFQVLNVYEGISSPSEVSNNLEISYQLNHDEQLEQIYINSLSITDGYLRNMQNIIPFGITLSYQWYENDIPINGQTSATLPVTSGDVGSVFTLGITASEILPYVETQRVGYAEKSIEIKTGYVYPQDGNWIVADPVLLYTQNEGGTDYDFWGFDSFVYENNNDIRINQSSYPFINFKMAGLIIKGSLSDALHYNTINLPDITYWRHFTYFSNDSNNKDPGLYKPYRRIINLDTGSVFDYTYGVDGDGFVFTNSSSQMINRSRNESIKGYSPPITGGSSFSGLLTTIRDAAENNQRILYAYARVPEELPTLP